MASSLAPFSRVLNDHLPDKASLTNQDIFHSKLKTLVRDHLPAILSKTSKVTQRNHDPWFIKEHRTHRGRTPVKRDPTPMQAGVSSPSQSSDNSAKGASSLVQMWEARLSQPTASNNSTNSPRCCSRSISSTLSCPENAFHSLQDEPLANVQGVRPFNEDFSTGWESDGTAAPTHPFPTQASTASGTERGRVANIIKSLTSKGDRNENEPSSPAADSPYREQERASPNDAATFGQKTFLQATSSPRIRGRQAFSDLLMQMERDRHNELESLSECRAVSRFSGKGRIQAHLKLKICGSSWSSPSNGLSIPQHRETFKAETELDLKEHNGVADPGAPHSPIIGSTSSMENTSMASEESQEEEVRNLDQLPEYPVPFPLTSVGSKDDLNSGDRTSDTLGKDDRNLDAIGRDGHNSEARTSDTMGKSDDDSDARMSDTMGKDEGSSNARITDTMGEIVIYDGRGPSLERQQSMDVCSSSSSRYEEEEEYNEELLSESNYDWISRISRPRSYWENRRQSWYQEMLEQESTKEDIRQLLQRRRVSNFLSSDFLEMMNDLMLRQQTNTLVQPEDDQIDVGFLLPISQTPDYLTSHQEEVFSNQPMQDGEEAAFQAEDNEQQDNSQTMGGGRHEVEHELLDEEGELEMGEEGDEGSDDQYRDASEHSDRSPLSSQSFEESPRRSWGFDDHDDPVASMSSARSPRPQAYFMDPLQHTRSMDHLSMEIELINELRGQMKQLQREMSKLRRSIKTCMDMQAPVHYSIKQEISSSECSQGPW